MVPFYKTVEGQLTRSQSDRRNQLWLRLRQMEKHLNGNVSLSEWFSYSGLRLIKFYKNRPYALTLIGIQGYNDCDCERKSVPETKKEEELEGINEVMNLEFGINSIFIFGYYHHDERPMLSWKFLPVVPKNEIGGNVVRPNLPAKVFSKSINIALDISVAKILKRILCLFMAVGFLVV